MSGEISYKDQLQKFEEILDEYKISLGLDNLQKSSEAVKYLNMNFNQLQSLSDEECSYASYALSQYSAYIQVEKNRHNSRSDWAENELGKIIAKQSTGGQNQYTKYELLKLQVISGNSAAQTLNKIILHAKCRNNELDQIADKISFMSRRIDNIISVRIKRKC